MKAKSVEMRHVVTGFMVEIARDCKRWMGFWRERQLVCFPRGEEWSECEVEQMRVMGREYG